MDRLFVPHRISRRSLIQRSEWLLRTVHECPDLDPRKCSRLCQIAHAVLKEGAQVIPADRSSFQVVLQGEKDLRELQYIWEVLSPSPENRAVWSKLKTVFGDKVLPADGASDSKARDAQFELLVFAILERSGLSPIINEQHADFSCELGANTVAVEAKRLTSIKRLEDRIRHAAQQIDKLNLPGIICLDFSYAVNPGNQVYVLKNPISEFQKAQTKRFESFWANNRKRVDRAIGKRRAIGLTLFDHLIMQTGLKEDGCTGAWELASIRDNVFLPSTVHGDRRLAETFFKLTSDLGLPTQVIQT